MTTDPEIRAWLKAQPVPDTYADMASAMAARFGAGRAMTADALRAWWLANRRARRAVRIERDGPVAAFIQARLGLRTDARIFAEVRAAFDRRQHPSRTTFYRFCQAQRRRDAGAVAAPPARVIGRRVATPK